MEGASFFGWDGWLVIGKERTGPLPSSSPCSGSSSSVPESSSWEATGHVMRTSKSMSRTMHRVVEVIGMLPGLGVSSRL